MNTFRVLTLLMKHGSLASVLCTCALEPELHPVRKHDTCDSQTHRAKPGSDSGAHKNAAETHMLHPPPSTHCPQAATKLSLLNWDAQLPQQAGWNDDKHTEVRPLYKTLQTSPSHAVSSLPV